MIARLNRLVILLTFKVRSSSGLLRMLSQQPNGRVLLILDVLKEREVFQDGTAREADLSRLQGQNVRLAMALLERVSFQGADLREGYFGDGRLTGANFREADLRQANFRNATLNHADFTNANVSNAYFAGANLQGARFDGADLRGANFWGAHMEGVTFDRALFDEETILPSA